MKPKHFTNFDAAIAWATEHGAGRALNLLVLHDDWCAHRHGSPCNCSPEYVIEELTVESYVRAVKGTRDRLESHRRN